VVELRANLKAERASKDFTQEYVAEIIDVTTRQYQAIESGESNGSMKVWEKLSALLGKPIDHLVTKASYDELLQPVEGGGSG